MITAAHVIAFAEDAQAARAFFRDVLDLPSVDAGDNWLIFALPPAELAVHPGPGWGQSGGAHRVFLMCDDIESTVAELQTRGVEFTGEIERQDWGLLAMMLVP